MPQMTPWHRFTQMAHLASLGLWLGTVVMSAAAAAVIFPTLKGLDPHLPDYSAYDGDHWLLAAGTVAERIFLIGDLIQFPCALIAAVTLAVLIVVHRLPRMTISTALRILALAIAIAALASQLIIVSQSMNRSVNLYRAAALAGDNDAARTHQAAFNELHPIAIAMMATIMVSVLIALAAGAWAAGSTGTTTTAATEAPRPGPALEEPLLLKGRR